MTNKISICLILLIITLLSSCSDDFLSKNKKEYYMLQDTLYLYSYQDKVNTQLQIPQLSESRYTIAVQPKWLAFDSMHGTIKGGALNLSFTILKDQLPSGYFTQIGNLILDVEGIGLISVLVSYSDYGSPLLNCSVDSLNFQTYDPIPITLTNVSQGILNWSVKNVPAWLDLSQTTGSLDPSGSVYLTVSLRTSMLEQGMSYSGVLRFESNSTGGIFEIPVSVSADAITTSSIFRIPGIVTDAEINHQSGIIAICTKNPNTLIIFDTSIDTTTVIPLDKSPVCVSIEENGHTAMIGYSVSAVGKVDIDNLQITGEYTIDCIPFDIVAGGNGWCYIAPASDQWINLRYLNLETGELFHESSFAMVYQGTIIKKVPGKPYMVGTRINLSPSGILIFDISEGRISDTVTYYHESLDNFWISQDCSKLYARHRVVYYLPQYDYLYHTGSPSQFGFVETADVIQTMDECPAIKSIFVATRQYDNSPGYIPVIERFDTENLNKTGSYRISSVTLSEGSSTLYESSARYIFVNKEGTSVNVIKNLKEMYNMDSWSMETLQLSGSK